MPKAIDKLTARLAGRWHAHLTKVQCNHSEQWQSRWARPGPAATEDQSCLHPEVDQPDGPVNGPANVRAGGHYEHDGAGGCGSLGGVVRLGSWLVIYMPEMGGGGGGMPYMVQMPVMSSAEVGRGVGGGMSNVVEMPRIMHRFTWVEACPTWAVDMASEQSKGSGQCPTCMTHR